MSRRRYREDNFLTPCERIERLIQGCPTDEEPERWEDERPQPTIELYPHATFEMGWTVDG